MKYLNKKVFIYTSLILNTLYAFLLQIIRNVYASIQVVCFFKYDMSRVLQTAQTAGLGTARRCEKHGSVMQSDIWLASIVYLGRVCRLCHDDCHDQPGSGLVTNIPAFIGT